MRGGGRCEVGVSLIGEGAERYDSTAFVEKEGYALGGVVVCIA